MYTCTEYVQTPSSTELKKAQRQAQIQKRLALRRVVIKRQLRKAGIKYSDKIIYNLGALRRLRTNVLSVDPMLYTYGS